MIIKMKNSHNAVNQTCKSERTGWVINKSMIFRLEPVAHLAASSEEGHAFLMSARRVAKSPLSGFCELVCHINRNWVVA